MRAVHHERRFVTFVGTEFRIDADGSIWRIGCSPGGYSNGRGRYPVRSVTPRRAEHRMADGYLRLSFNPGGGQIKVLAHRAVWVHLRGPIPDGMEINHKNGLKHDNRPANLELVTPSENVLHRIDVLGHVPVPERMRRRKPTPHITHAQLKRSAP